VTQAAAREVLAAALRREWICATRHPPVAASIDYGEV